MESRFVIFILAALLSKYGSCLEELDPDVFRDAVDRVAEAHREVIQTDTFPAKNLSVFLGERVVVGFKKDHESNTCQLTPPSGAKMWYGKSGQAVVTREGGFSVTINSDCGITIEKATPDCQGVWQFGSLGNVSYEANITIEVKPLPVDPRNITLQLGVLGQLSLGPPGSVYCSALSPWGARLPCEISLPEVQPRHAGVWRADVGFKGATHAVPYTYNVQVLEGPVSPDSMRWQVSSRKEWLGLLCTLPLPGDSCRMTRSDHKTFIMTPGIGNSNYDYYGNGTIQNRDGSVSFECGIQIKFPGEEDLKNWTCVIQHSNHSAESSIVIPVHQEANVVSPPVMKETVETSMGAPLALHCHDETFSPLDYCWFMAPNGTQYLSSPEISNQSYSYLGAGLWAGHCGILIHAASRSDEGQWRCNLATSQEQAMDVMFKIKAKIYESVMISNQRNVAVQKGSVIACKTYDSSSLEYCRFIRPDGQGINPLKNVSGYSGAGTFLEDGVCSLQLTGHPYTYDLGRWRCLGKPADSPLEYQTIVTVATMWYWAETNGGASVVMFLLYTITISAVTALIFVGLFRLGKNQVVRSRARGIRQSFSFSGKKKLDDVTNTDSNI